MKVVVDTAVSAQPKFRFHGRSLLAFVLTPQPPLAAWFADFEASVRRSAGFFAGRPVILDLSRLAPARDELHDLLAQFRDRKLRILAVEGVEHSWLAPDLTPIAGGGTTSPIETGAERQTDADRHTAAVPPARPDRAATPALVIDTPVRSGQSVVFPDGDVTIVGAVSSGAEVIAGGSVHVYGALRGRVIAGSAGNPKARIFCRRLEAELVAIDGLYLTADDMQPELRGRAVQAWLDRDTLMMASLD